jgi:anti-anti-sigma factor
MANELVCVDRITLPGMVWIQLEGELDLDATATLSGRLSAMTFQPEDFIVLDARGIEFCDLCGLDVLTAVLQDWGEQGHAASCLLSPAVDRVARLVGADALLRRREDVTLLAHVASATLGDVEAPLADWASALAPQEPPGPISAAGASATLAAPPAAVAKELLEAECARAEVTADRSRVLFDRCLTVQARARATVADSLARRAARAG